MKSLESSDDPGHGSASDTFSYGHWGRWQESQFHQCCRPWCNIWNRLQYNPQRKKTLKIENELFKRLVCRTYAVAQRLYVVQWKKKSKETSVILWLYDFFCQFEQYILA